MAAIYLTFILHTPTRSIITPLLNSPSTSQIAPPVTVSSTITTTKPIRRSTRHSTSSLTSAPLPTASQQQQDPITFLSELNISLPLIATISQEIISLYTLWERYKEDAHPEAKSSTITTATTPSNTDTMDSKEETTQDLLFVDSAMNSLTTNCDAATRRVPQKMKEVVPKELSDLLYNMRVARLELDSSLSSRGGTGSNVVYGIHVIHGGHDTESGGGGNIGGGTGAIYISHQQQGHHQHHQQQQQRQNQSQSQVQYQHSNQHLGYTSGSGSMKMTGVVGTRGAAVNKMLERTQNAG